MASIEIDAVGSTQLLMGNEAISRGALEAGIGVATSYAGTPASEIIGSLAPISQQLGIYTEWSINEKVAVEVAAGASFAGIRAITAMKYNGLNVASDVVALLGPGDLGKGGLVLVVADDPGGISSDNEQDTRNLAKMLEIPLLEPSSPQEAKDMTKWLFNFSEELKHICILRTVTRVCHTRSNVKLGELPKIKRKAYFDETYDPHNPTLTRYNPLPTVPRHIISLKKLDKAREIFELSPFNEYLGPDKVDLLIITCGPSLLYSQEAVRALNLMDKVGILKIGTLSPLPNRFVEKHLNKAQKILVVEEIDAFLERSVMEVIAKQSPNGPDPIFYGKSSGHVKAYGELNSNIVIQALIDIMGVKYKARKGDYVKRAQEISKKYIPERGRTLCPGCPHRATFWVIKNALRQDGRNGFCTGDIGCYQMGLRETGYYQLRTCQSMGSSAGIACGLGKLEQFGFKQPVLAVCGDSTFFHSVIPALINGIYSQSNFVLIVLDNNATAMTGFQPHPGTGITAMGNPTKRIGIKELCCSLGIQVEICDPFEIKKNIRKLRELMAEYNGPKVIIMRRECELIRSRREQGMLYKMLIDPNKCKGKECSFCIREFKCPGLTWDGKTGKIKTDEAICSGCGVCVDICPHGAISRGASS